MVVAPAARRRAPAAVLVVRRRASVAARAAAAHAAVAARRWAGSGAASTSCWTTRRYCYCAAVSYQTFDPSLPALRAVSCQAAGGDGEPVVEAADSRGVYQRSSSRRAIALLWLPLFWAALSAVAVDSDACYGCLWIAGGMGAAPRDEWHI